MKLPKLIGVIRLPALAGSPFATELHPAEALQRAGIAAVHEAQVYAKAGFDAVLIENYGDRPYYKNQVPPETVASMAIIAAAVREAAPIQVGIQVLRNDARAALAIAAVTGCDFIRVSVLSGVTATDQGLVEGDAAFLLRERERLGAPILILADVHVQNGVTLSSFDLGIAIQETALRAHTDAVIITSRMPGVAMDLEAVRVAHQAAKFAKVPLLLGSGVTRDTLETMRPWVDGVIMDLGMDSGSELDQKLVREFGQAFTHVSKKQKKGSRKKK